MALGDGVSGSKNKRESDQRIPLFISGLLIEKIR